MNQRIVLSVTCVLGAFALSSCNKMDPAVLDAKASVQAVATVEKSVVELDADVDNLGGSVVALQSQLSALSKKVDVLESRPATPFAASEADLLGNLRSALFNPAASSNFRNNVIYELVNVKGGIDVLVSFILTDPANRSSTTAIDQLVRSFSEHPSYEKSLRLIMALDESKLTGGEKLKQAQLCKSMAKTAMYGVAPEEFVDEYLESTLKYIIERRHDPSNAETIFANVAKSLDYRDRAKKADYVDTMISMYGKAFGTSECKAGHACLVRLTGQSLGTDKYSTKDREETTKAYKEWFAANRDKLPK